MGKGFPKDVLGTIGVNFFKHFNMFIDLKNQKIYLQKHDKTFEKKQYSNLGCSFAIMDDKLQIGRVFENSPIDSLGIKKGDILIEMNGIKAKDISETVIGSLMKSKRGDDITMTIKSNNKVRVVNFKAYDNPLNYFNQ